MAVESHYRNHSDSKSDSSSDKWNNSELLAHFKRSQHNLRDAMRGYDICIDYTSKRIDSVSIATLAPIREQHLHRTYPSQPHYSNWHHVARYENGSATSPLLVIPCLSSWVRHSMFTAKAHFSHTLLQREQRPAQESFQVPDENRISKSNPWSHCHDNFLAKELAVGIVT